MRFIIMIFILFTSSFVNAENIKINIPEWKGYSNSDGTGYYWDILRSIYEAQGIKMIHLTVPFKRALKEVEYKKADASAGVLKTNERIKKFTYSKSQIDNEVSGVIFLKEMPFDTVQNLKGKIGKVIGYDYSAWLPSHLNIYEVNNTSIAIRMLRAKRLQYHADEVYDIESTIKQLKERRDDFIIATTDFKPLYVIFTKDKRGQRMAKIYDRGNRRLYETGKLEEIKKKYEIDKKTYNSKDFMD